MIRKHKLPTWEVGRIAAVIIPFGMMLGRIGNFVNKELPGRITTVPWAMDFGDGLMRHPAQLYAAGKDLVLFLIFLTLFRKTNIPGQKFFGLFLMSYAIFRFTVEFFREPDVIAGFDTSVLTMGQILSIILFVIGGVLFVLASKSHGKV
jgi:phosphatidylglycerol:prolipoprotein diacylglycerol transferase